MHRNYPGLGIRKQHCAGQLVTQYIGITFECIGHKCLYAHLQVLNEILSN